MILVSQTLAITKQQEKRKTLKKTHFPTLNLHTSKSYVTATLNPKRIKNQIKELL